LPPEKEIEIPGSKTCRVLAKEKWTLDFERQKYLESLGYNVTIVWESKLHDYRN
jgi:G:T-mismatch repair DNA endonuclease (very short patch repair protein)